MPKANKYNVYDKGKLIIENQTHREIAKRIDCSNICIANYADSGFEYAGRYTFELCELEQPEPAVKETAFAREWNAAVALFKNVIWVKEGGKQLRVGGRVKCG